MGFVPQILGWKTGLPQVPCSGLPAELPSQACLMLTGLNTPGGQLGHRERSGNRATSPTRPQPLTGPTTSAQQPQWEISMQISCMSYSSVQTRAPETGPQDTLILYCSKAVLGQLDSASNCSGPHRKYNAQQLHGLRPLWERAEVGRPGSGTPHSPPWAKSSKPGWRNKAKQGLKRRSLTPVAARTASRGRRGHHLLP